MHCLDIKLAVMLIVALQVPTALILDAAPADDCAKPERIVARQDYDVSAKLAPPEIMGRRFWNVLGRYLYLKSDNRPRELRYNPQERYAYSNEAMVHDAVPCYHVRDGLLSTNDGVLLMNDAKLQNMDPDMGVPFVLSSRPFLACQQSFQVEKKGYRKWKKEHPNFLGFMAGAEWDSDFMGYLRRDVNESVKLLRKWGMSDDVVNRMRDIFAPASKDRDHALAALRECYLAARKYCFDDPEKMLFLRGGWCWDHYPLEWGSAGAIMETTNTGPYRHQVSMFFARGAARQYLKFWSWYIAVCYNGNEENGKYRSNVFPYFLTTNDAPTFVGNGDVYGPTCGMSPSLHRRDFYLGYLAGASMVQPETYPYAYWQFKNHNKKDGYELSPFGEDLKELYAFAQRHPDRGVSYAPVALLIPFNQGYAQWGGSPWSYFPMERPDSMIDAFTYTLVPFSDKLSEGLEGCLANSPYGDIYDVILPNPPHGVVALDVLMNYKVAILLGGFKIDKPLAKRLMKYVKKGGTLVVNIRQFGDTLPEDFVGAKRSGIVCGTDGAIKVAGGCHSAVLSEPYDYEQIELNGAKPLWLDGKGGILASVNQYGSGRVVLTGVDFMLPRKSFCDINIDAYIRAMKARQHPLVQLLMQQIVQEALPVEVKGDIEYGLNKVADGWWVYLINNKGVSKFVLTPERLNSAATARVAVNMRKLAVGGVRELRAEEDIAWDRDGKSFFIDVGPGDIKVVKITVRDK